MSKDALIEDLCSDHAEILIKISKSSVYDSIPRNAIPKVAYSKLLYLGEALELGEKVERFFLEHPSSNEEVSCISSVHMVDNISYRKAYKSAQILEQGLQDAIEFLNSSGHLKGFQHYLTMKYNL